MKHCGKIKREKTNPNMIKRIFVFAFVVFATWAHAQNRSELVLSKAGLQPIVAVDSPLAHRADERVGGHIYRYLNFKSIPTAEQQEYLAKAGVILHEYLGENTYRAAIPADLPQYILAEGQAIAQGSQSVDAKASEELLLDVVPDYAEDDDQLKVLVHIAPEVGFDRLSAKLSVLGATLEESNGINTVVQVTVPKKAVADLLRQAYVLGVDFIPPPAVKDDRQGRSLHRMDRVNGTNSNVRGYTGEGISISVRDDGRVFDHKDFEGRVDQTSVGISRGDHGDGVAGIFVGAGNIDPDMQGMAYGAFMYVQDYTANFLDNTMSLHQNQNVLVTNSSYSDGCNQGYTSSTRTVDQQLYDNPTLMHVFSAGNDGFSDCGFGAGDRWGNITGGHKMGKNVLTVANLNFRGEVEGSSSRGPATDGRIKPDIAANGFGHESTAEQTNGYMVFGGTSAAAPVIAGITTVLHDAYQQVHGETAVAALLKAILLNTATDSGNVGPDFIFGWGIANAHRAALAIEQSRFEESTINQGEEQTHTISVPENVYQVKVMVYWPDEEGVGVDRDLKMDLDATIQRDGVTYMPWVLDPTPDPARLSLPATKGEDHLNNMEQIAIDLPEAGDYTLTVSGTEVPFANSQYYITWEFLTNDIDITYPNGGENLRASVSDIVQWDAAGDQGSFTLELIDATGAVLRTATASGDERRAQLQMPGFVADAKVRITRADGVSDESDDSFLVARIPTNLQTTEDNGVRTLTWSDIPQAVSYNVYTLGERYMEVVATSETNSFDMPNTEAFDIGWIAVSAVYDNGREGQRSVARSIRNTPELSFSNLDDGKPCINSITTFSLTVEEPEVEYDWQFGENALPQNADGPGPHPVIFTREGQEVVILRGTNEAGTTGDAILVDIQPLPEGDDIMMEDLGTGEYIFSSNAERVDEYEWIFGDGNTGSGAVVSHVYTTPGVYTVFLFASGECGEVELEETFNIIVVSVEDLTEADFTLSPNPTSGVVTLTLPDLEGEVATVEIYDAVGRQLSSLTMGRQSGATKQDLNMEDYPAGLYTVMVRYGSYSIQKRLVKE